MERILPTIAIHEIVEVGDDVSEWASVVAERDPAVHTTRRLHSHVVGGERLVHLAPVEQAHGYGPARRRLPSVRHETLQVTHVRQP